MISNPKIGQKVWWNGLGSTPNPKEYEVAEKYNGTSCVKLQRGKATQMAFGYELFSTREAAIQSELRDIQKSIKELEKKYEKVSKLLND